MAKVSLRKVSKLFGDTAAVRDFSLEAENGEFVALLGSSGCGKTTIVRLIAGFERVSGGEIAFNGEAISSPNRHMPAARHPLDPVGPQAPPARAAASA